MHIIQFFSSSDEAKSEETRLTKSNPLSSLLRSSQDNLQFAIGSTFYSFYYPYSGLYRLCFENLDYSCFDRRSTNHEVFEEGQLAYGASLEFLPFKGKKLVFDKILIHDEKTFWKVLNQSRGGRWYLHPVFNTIYFFSQEENYSEFYIIQEENIQWSFKAHVALYLLGKGLPLSKKNLEKIQIDLDQMLESSGNWFEDMVT